MNRPIREKKIPVRYDASDESNEPPMIAKLPKKVKRTMRTENTNGEGSSTKIMKTPPISMNLQSCPEEMLASVLKYCRFQTVKRIRKTNKHMDYVAIKYKINLPKVDSAGFGRYGQSDPTIYVNLRNVWIWEKAKSSNTSRMIEPKLTYDQSSILNVFQEFAKKMRLDRCIGFHNCDIDQNIVDLLLKMRIRKKVYLSIEVCNFTVPVEILAHVLLKYPKSRIRNNIFNTIMNEPFGTDKVMTALIPHAGIFYNWMPAEKSLPEFTDEVLRVACQHMPHVLDIGCYCPFSLTEIEKTMLHLIEYNERNRNKSIHWQFGTLQVNSKEDLILTAKNIKKNIPGTLSNRRNLSTSIWYKANEWSDLFKLRLEVR